MKSTNSSTNKLKGHRFEVVVESLANSGDGVGRIHEKVVFIPYSCPGDRLLVEITKEKKSFAHARIVEILTASEDRREAPCSLFTQCGGCDWQHISYSTQLFWKRENLVQALKRIGHLDLDSQVTDTQASPQEFYYRNRIQVHIDKEGPYFLRKGSHQGVPVAHCPIAERPINDHLANSHRSQKVKKVEWAVMENHQVESFPVNDRGISSLGFRQVNSGQNQWIRDQMKEWLQEKQVSSLLDLYCGQGNWAKEISKVWPQIKCTGVDDNPVNIKKATAHNPNACDFILGDVDRIYPKIQEDFDVTIIDPPRAGCSTHFIDLLNQSPSPYLIYISCDPATFSRDLSLLTQGPWTLEKIIPVDMFPQTPHLECLSFLHSAKGAKTAN